MERNEILAAYLNSDEDRRIGIFLTYRELREDFTLIERRGEAAAPRAEE